MIKILCSKYDELHQNVFLRKNLDVKIYINNCKIAKTDQINICKTAFVEEICKFLVWLRTRAMDVGSSTEVCGLSGRVQGVNIVNEREPEVDDRRHGRNLQTVDTHGCKSTSYRENSPRID